MSSLTFDYNFPSNGTYYFGLRYTSNNTASYFVVEVDGVPAFGYVPTPYTYVNNALVQPLATSAGDAPAVIATPGVHQITLVVALGSVVVDSFLISKNPIPVTVRPPPTVAPPKGEVFVPVTQFSSAVGNATTTPPNNYFVSIDQGVLFCRSHLDPSIQYWCLNEPSLLLGSVSRLYFDYKFTSSGVYYFGVNYATNDTNAVLNVYFDGAESFGSIPTPPTGGWEVFATEKAAVPITITAPGTHSIILEVAASHINIDYFIVSYNPIPVVLTTLPPVTTPVVTLPPASGAPLTLIRFPSSGVGGGAILASALTAIAAVLLIRVGRY